MPDKTQHAKVIPLPRRPRPEAMKDIFIYHLQFDVHFIVLRLADYTHCNPEDYDALYGICAIERYARTMPLNHPLFTLMARFAAAESNDTAFSCTWSEIESCDFPPLPDEDGDIDYEGWLAALCEAAVDHLKIYYPNI